VTTLTSAPEWSEFFKKHASVSGAEEWPGNPGASEERLAAAEARLKIKLPPSYRAFLGASNGWNQASRAVPELRPVEKIRWFRREHKEWVQAYVDPMRGIYQRLPSEHNYFNYATEDSLNFDVTHLAQTLCISEVGDSAVLLLNPMVVWPDGEWETWFFANWLPGATRYRSFADWMRKELAGFLDETFAHTVRPGELPTVFLDGPAKAVRRIRPREEILVLADVLKKLESEKSRERFKSVQNLCRLGGQGAVDALIQTLRSDPDSDVRREAAEALGKLQVPASIDPLIAAIDDPEVNTTAIHALAGFKDEKSARCLLKILDEGGWYATSAVDPLAKRGEARAVQSLLRFLTSKDPRDDHIGNIAGRLIAEFQEAGLLALEPLMNNPDTEIRSRAINGMGDLASLARDRSVKLRARKIILQSVNTETDPRLRELLIIIAQLFSGKNPGISENPFEQT